jgi:hypothetical protein
MPLRIGWAAGSNFHRSLSAGSGCGCAPWLWELRAFAVKWKTISCCGHSAASDCVRRKENTTYDPWMAVAHPIAAPWVRRVALQPCVSSVAGKNFFSAAFVSSMVTPSILGALVIPAFTFGPFILFAPNGCPLAFLQMFHLAPPLVRD